MPEGLKPVTRTLSGGVEKTYWYHRATGERVDPEEEFEPFSISWLLEVERLNEKAQAVAATVVIASEARRTFFDLWLEYRGSITDPDSGSPEWRDLKPRTKDDYQKVRDWLGDAAAKRMVVKNLTDDQILKLRDKGAKEKGRRFGNYVLSVVRLVLNWGRARGWLGKGDKKRENPASDVKSIKRPKHARRVNRAWTDDEVRAFAADAPFQLLVPFVLGLFAGMREGDALAVGRLAYDGSKIRWIASKNSEECEAPVAGAFKIILDQAIELAKGLKVVPHQLALNSYGDPWTESGFRASFFKFLRKLMAEGKVRPGCTFHGLRYTVTSSARDGGHSNFQAAAGIGDKTTAMADLYGQDADRLGAQGAVLAGVQKRFENIHMENASGKRLKSSAPVAAGGEG